MGIVKQYAKKAVKAVKRRYTTKKGKTNITKMVSDIKKLQMVLNPEKKRYNQGNVSGVTSYVQFAQVNVNAPAYFGLDITPIPAQGITDITRNGDSIKLHSQDLKFNFIYQSGCLSDMRVKYYVLQTLGVTYGTVGSAILDFFNPNSFNGLYDMNCDRNYDKIGTLKIVRQGSWFFKGPDQNNVVDRSVYSKRIGLKYKNHHIKFVNNTTTVGTGQLFLIMFTDRGNSNTVNSSTVPNIPITAVNTGLDVNYDFTSFFYDN